MELTVLLFLTSGLFLGWSLGANDAANVFGTAVGTRMVRFTTAALICSIFVILGAVISGAGAAHTLGKLGSVNALAGSFMAALSAAVTVYGMTRIGLPVSTTQAIVGAIIGWNLFSGSVTDTDTLIMILATWIACPVLAGLLAAPIFKGVQAYLRWAKIHLLRQDAYTRLALILAGAFGAYSLGANNIANVMGVFVPVSPFTDLRVANLFAFTSAQQLFLLGAVAIGVGVFTYSKKVMLTVGSEITRLSPVAAWVVVMSHSIVLFLFASEGLENLLARAGLPTIPLVPVSSSQAVVGAVVGIGLLKGGKEIRWRLLANIGAGWVTTPIISAAVCFVALFFLQNVFNQQVYREVHYALSPTVMGRLVAAGIPVEDFAELTGREFRSSRAFRDVLSERADLTASQESKTLYYAELAGLSFDPVKAKTLEADWLTEGQVAAIRRLTGRTFTHKWAVAEALARESEEWKLREETKVNKIYNKETRRKLEFVYRTFGVGE